MGNCAAIQNTERTTGLPGPSGTPSVELNYPRSAHVSIKLRNENLDVVYREKLVFAVTEPVISCSHQLNFGPHSAWVSGRIYSASVIPGLDPRGQIPKTCQDMCFVETLGESLFIGLFDGHGKEGKKVVDFCKNFMLAYYLNNRDHWESNPSQFLTDVTQNCDKALVKRGSGIDANYSGTTAVIYLIFHECVYLACVGDSRVILATSKPPDYVTPTAPPRGEDKEILERVKRRRSVSIDKPLQGIQMTKDQKPEEPEETERIMSMGGVVRRLMDELGRNVGPWRVWRRDANYPGLAMSRSIGDIAGSEIGVISTPLITAHMLRAGDDFFLVSASDGVWDVMENQEVADFVEAYRPSCIRDIQSPLKTDKIRPMNSTIAQLLCEEARTRWLSIVEEEDVVIDDISCVILELKDCSMQLVLPPSRISVPNLDAVDLPGHGNPSIPTTEVKLRDPRRSSMSE